MQTGTVDVFLSVDGWAGSATSPGYFGYFGPEPEEWITDELALPQLVVLGRRTYEALAGLPEEARDEPSQRMAKLNKVVFSTTLKTVSWPNTRICHDDVITEVTRLKVDGDVPLRTMGSLSVARQLLGGPRRPAEADDVSAAQRDVNHYGPWHREAEAGASSSHGRSSAVLRAEMTDLNERSTWVGAGA